MNSRPYFSHRFRGVEALLVPARVVRIVRRHDGDLLHVGRESRAADAKAPAASTTAMAVAVAIRLEILVIVEASSFPRFIVTHAYYCCAFLTRFRAAQPFIGGAISCFLVLPCNALRTATRRRARSARSASICSGVYSKMPPPSSCRACLGWSSRSRILRVARVHSSLFR